MGKHQRSLQSKNVSHSPLQGRPKEKKAPETRCLRSLPADVRSQIFDFEPFSNSPKYKRCQKNMPWTFKTTIFKPACFTPGLILGPSSSSFAKGASLSVIAKTSASRGFRNPLSQRDHLLTPVWTCSDRPTRSGKREFQPIRSWKEMIKNPPSISKKSASQDIKFLTRSQIYDKIL